MQKSEKSTPETRVIDGEECEAVFFQLYKDESGKWVIETDDNGYEMFLNFMEANLKDIEYIHNEEPQA